MDGDDDLDTHICLACQMPILGLDNYVYHKRVTCPAKKTPSIPKLPETVSEHGEDMAPQPMAYTSHTATIPLHNQALSVSSSDVSSVPCTQNNMDLLVTPQQDRTLEDATISSMSGNTGTSYSNTPTRFSVVDPNMVLCNISSTGPHLSSEQTPAPSLAETESTTHLQDNTPSIMDFLSSLELQCRSTPCQGKALPSGERDEGLGSIDDRVGLGSALESRESEGLKLASLLNDLNFDSDSEGFDMPSDAEDLLNFDEDVYGELNTSYAAISLKGKEVGFGKGKGKISFKMESAMKGGKKGKSMNYPGKWKPGERHTGGKTLNTRHVSIGKRHYEALSSDEDDNYASADHSIREESADHGEQQPCNAEGSKDFAEADATTKAAVSRDLTNRMTDTDSVPPDTDASENRGKSSDHDYVSNFAQENVGEGNFQCEPCSKPFKNRKALHTHIRSEQHEQLVSLSEDQQQSLKAQKDVSETRNKAIKSYCCPSCEKSFNNKYNFVRHLMSSLHQKKSNSSLVHLDPGFQKLMLRLKPYQCRVCEFFCNSHEDLVQHLNSAEHKDQSSELVGPMCCVRCLYVSRSHEDMMNHFMSGIHSEKVAASDRPCTLREIRKDLDCLLCQKKFHSATTLKRHLASKHPQDPAAQGTNRLPPRKSSICPICDKNCKTKYNMQVHMRRRHTHEKPYSCDICGKNFTELSTLNAHYKSQRHLDNVLKASAITSPAKADKVSRKKAFKCKECDFSATVYTMLRPHYIECHSTNMYLCEVCGTKFLSQTLLDKHKETRKHKKNEQEAEARGHCSLTCTHCGQKFYTKEKLSLHALSHMPQSTRKGRNASSTKFAGVPKAFHSFVSSLPKKCPGMTIECPVCKKLFKISNIVVHLRSHGDPTEQPYKCNFCTKTFTSNSTLYRHHKSHLGIRPFECNLCNKTFKGSTQLHSHQLKAHPKQTDVKAQFKCSTCGREFIEASRFRIHVKYHDKSQKQYKCDYTGCNKSFVLMATLRNHELVHSGEKPFLCDLCGFTTKTVTHMNRHRRVHTGECNYQCQYCTFKSSHSWGLRRHMRIHIGCKPYKCPYCEYRCNCHTNLRHHVLSSKRHAGLPIYRCKVCEMGTNNAKEYQKHMIEMHQVPEEEIENIGVYAGIYIKESDPRAVEEGSQVLPVRERKARAPNAPRKKAPSPKVELAEATYPIEHVVFQDRKPVESVGTTEMSTEVLTYQTLHSIMGGPMIHNNPQGCVPTYHHPQGHTQQAFIHSNSDNTMSWTENHVVQ